MATKKGEQRLRASSLEELHLVHYLECKDLLGRRWCFEVLQGYTAYNEICLLDDEQHVYGILLKIDEVPGEDGNPMLVAVTEDVKDASIKGFVVSFENFDVSCMTKSDDVDISCRRYGLKLPDYTNAERAGICSIGDIIDSLAIVCTRLSKEETGSKIYAKYNKKIPSGHVSCENLLKKRKSMKQGTRDENKNEEGKTDKDGRKMDKDGGPRRRISYFDTPTLKLMEISAQTNLKNEKNRFVSPFQDKVEQARAQWEIMGCPPRAEQGKSTPEEFKNYEEVVKLTFGKSTVNEMHNLITSERKVFDKWITAMEMFNEGKLPGEPKSGKEICMSLFRCTIQLKPNEMEETADALIDGKVSWVKGTNVLTVQEFTDNLKHDRILKEAVVQYLRKYTRLSNLTIQRILNESPSIHSAWNELRSYCESWCKAQLNSRQANSQIPAWASYQLESLWDKDHGHSNWRKHNVVMVYDVGPRVSKIHEIKECEKNRSICLTVTHTDGDWKKDNFKMLVDSVADINAEESYSFLFFLSPYEIQNCIDVLTKIEGKVQLAFGYHESSTDKRSIISVKTYVVLALVAKSRKSNLDNLVQKNLSLEFRRNDETPSFDPAHDIPKTETGSRDLYLQPLSYSMIGRDQVGLLVKNTISRSAILRFIDCLSKPNQTVVEVNCGGNIAREALLMGREVLVFTESVAQKTAIEAIVNIFSGLSLFQIFAPVRSTHSHGQLAQGESSKSKKNEQLEVLSSSSTSSSSFGSLSNKSEDCVESSLNKELEEIPTVLQEDHEAT